MLKAVKNAEYGGINECDEALRKVYDFTKYALKTWTGNRLRKALDVSYACAEFVEMCAREA
jgi:hypothetical protein